MGADIQDQETNLDRQNMEQYAEHLDALGYSCEVAIGYGPAKQAIPKYIGATPVDVLVMGAHGHRTIKDLIFGETVDAVRHAVKVPVLIVR